MPGDGKQTTNSFDELGQIWKQQKSEAEADVSADGPVQATERASTQTVAPEALLQTESNEIAAPVESQVTDEPAQTSEFDKILSDLEALRRDQAALRSAAGKLRRENSALTATVQKLQRQKESLRTNARTLADALQDKRREQAGKVRQLNAQIKRTIADLTSTGRKLKAATRDNERLRGELTQARSFTLPLRWLEQGLGTDTDLLHPEVVLSGKGPFSDKEFRSHLMARGIKVRLPTAPKVAVMIVGRESWHELELEKQIYAREGKILRVYSQELALMSLSVGRDVLEEASSDLLDSLAVNHPALAFLASSELRWPNIHPPALPSRFEPFEFERGEVDQSPLKQLGYTVGKTQGLPQGRRQKILRSAFADEIPWTHSDNYMAEWGQPRTRRRLWRMAHHLAWLARNRSRIPSHRIAVSEWATDLAFLRKTFFRPYMRFKWPQTRVPGA